MGQILTETFSDIINYYHWNLIFYLWAILLICSYYS